MESAETGWHRGGSGDWPGASSAGVEEAVPEEGHQARVEGVHSNRLETPRSTSDRPNSKGKVDGYHT